MERQSVIIITKALVANKSISLTARLLLAQLQEHRNRRTGQCNPRRATLARELGVSVPTVSRALGELRQANLIRSTKRQYTNSYRIQTDQFDPSQGGPDGSKRSGWSDQFDPAGPPYPLYEPYQGEPGRPRAEARSRRAPSEENPPNAALELSGVPRKDAGRETAGIDGGGPIDLYYSAILGSVRNRGRLLTACEERQVGDLMMLKTLQRLKAEGKVG